MSLRLLFRQTAIYGISTIVIRLASWFLTPYYSRVILDKSSIGINAELMSYIAIVNIVYMIGMETSYFRYTNDFDEKKVYSTTVTTVFLNSLFWTVLFVVLATPIVNYLQYLSYININNKFHKCLRFLGCVVYCIVSLCCINNFNDTWSFSKWFNEICFEESSSSC